MIIHRIRLPWFLASMLIVCVTLHVAPELKAQPASFVSVLPDLPLMEGLLEDTDSAVVFETDAGRIAEAIASGSLEQKSIVKFYVAALPQLGWHLLSNVRYQREGEVLSLEFSSTSGSQKITTVLFKLAPAIP